MSTKLAMAEVQAVTRRAAAEAAEAAEALVAAALMAEAEVVTAAAAAAAEVEAPLLRPQRASYDVATGAPSAASNQLASELPACIFELLEQMRMGKYKSRFAAEDVSETSMLCGMLELPEGAADLRFMLCELGMSVGHRERLVLTITRRGLVANSRS
mgnify:FL=1